MDSLDIKDFYRESGRALEHIEATLADCEHDSLDVELAGDVLTLVFADGTRYVINAHSAARQIWMAADKSAWHFDWDGARWVAGRTGDELMSTLANVVSHKLGTRIEIA